jgi:MoaA/NifB/PqqE/SkfB family radical SAM enzyme
MSVPATGTAPAAIDPISPIVPTFLELEITQFCQLKCTHCYSESGPQSGRGTMTPDDWKRLMDEAAAAGVEIVQFIGGEPTLDPDLPSLAHYALSIGLYVDIRSNLVHVTPEMWELFEQPAVSVGFSWYSTDPAKHGEVTGSIASHARTRANIIEAVRRGVGRAANGAAPSVTELCGQCGKGRAAIGVDGQLTPCVLGRFLVAGNVRDTPLTELFAGDTWREILASVPELNACATCTPADSNDCQPSRRPAA